MTRKIKDILKENQRDIDILLGGPTRLIVAERRNNNIASTLFAKSSFSQCLSPEGENQKCESASNRCMTCDLMDLDRTVVLWKNHPDGRQTLKLEGKNIESESCLSTRGDRSSNDGININVRIRQNIFVSLRRA